MLYITHIYTCTLIYVYIVYTCIELLTMYVYCDYTTCSIKCHHTVTVNTLSSTVGVVSNYCLTTVVLDNNLSKLLLNHYSTEITLSVIVGYKDNCFKNFMTCL